MKLMRKYRGTYKVLIAVTCSIILGRSALSLPDLDENKLNILAEMSPTDTVVLIGVDKLDQLLDKVSLFFDRETTTSELVPEHLWPETESYVDGISNDLGFNPLSGQSYDRIGLNLNLPLGFAITGEGLPLFFIPVTDIEAFHGYLDERSPFIVEIYNNNDGVTIFHTSDESPLFWINVGDYLVATSKEDTPINDVGNLLIAATEGASLASIDAYRDTTDSLNNEWELAGWFGMRTIADIIPAPRRESGSSLSLISEILSIDSTAFALSSFDGSITHESATNFNGESSALNYLRTVDQNAPSSMNQVINVSSIYNSTIRANWPELLATLRSFTPIRNNLIELQESMTNETGFNLNQIAEFWPSATGNNVSLNEDGGLEVWAGGIPNGDQLTGGQIVEASCPVRKENSGNNSVIDLQDGTACILSSLDSPTILLSTSELFGAFITGPLNEAPNQTRLHEMLTSRANAILQGQHQANSQNTEDGEYSPESGLYTGHLSTSLLVDSLIPMLPESASSNDTIIQTVARSLAGDASARLWLENDLLRSQATWRSSFDNTSGFGLATVGAIAAIAIPNFVTMQYRAKRAEIPTNVSSIRTSLINYEAEFDAYIETSPHPEGPPDAQARIWGGGNMGFNELGWAPDGNVRGQYWVTTNTRTKGATGSDFIVWGRSDIDNDGIYATYTATKSINTTFLNNNDTY